MHVLLFLTNSKWKWTINKRLVSALLFLQSNYKIKNEEYQQRKNTQKNENEIEDYTPSLDNDERQMIIIMLLVNEVFQWCGFSFSRFHHFY